MVGHLGGWEEIFNKTLDFSSGHDPRVMGSSPASGSVLTAWSLLEILSLSLSLSLSPSAPLSHPCALALSLQKKINKNKIK